MGFCIPFSCEGRSLATRPWETRRQLTNRSFVGSRRFVGDAQVMNDDDLDRKRLRELIRLQKYGMEGQEEARELSAANYGRDEWWLLLNPVQEAEAGGSL